MATNREELIRRNQKFIQLPMPKLSEMTIEELEKRADFLEQGFVAAFKKQDSKDKSL